MYCPPGSGHSVLHTTSPPPSWPSGPACPADVIERLERGQQRLTVELIDTLIRGLDVRLQELLGTGDMDAVMRHVSPLLSPQAHRVYVALMRDLQLVPLSPQGRMALATRLRQFLRWGI